MNFIQAIHFNTSLGGNVSDLCLDNVRRGFGISNKYNTAWEAWQHTQQHADRNIPVGLDVPLYYSYTTTINNDTQNYGHINVRLANGTVWSDGNIYQSIDDYTSKKLPKFVGWGESVNDYQILKEGSSIVKPNKQQVIDEFAKFNATPSPGQISYYTGKTVDVLYGDLINGECPSAQVIISTFKIMANATPSPEQIDFYSKKVIAILLKDLAQPATPTNFKPYSGAQLFVEGGQNVQ